VNKVINKVGKPKSVAADAAYKTPAITSCLIENEITPALPYTRPGTKEGFFRKHEYVYGEYFDSYLCSVVEVLKYSTTNNEGIVSINHRNTFARIVVSVKYLTLTIVLFRGMY
jgi:hypothetical protein